MSSAPVYFCAERMKYTHTGLYHYCLHLYKALAQQAPANLPAGVYGPESAREILDNPAAFVSQNSLHKFFMPKLPGIRLWHSTYQGSNYGPSSDKIRVVQTVHDLNFLHENKAAHKVKRYLKKLRRRLDRADHIVCISRYVEQEVRNHLSVDSKPVSVIYNGCNVDVRAPQSRPAIIPADRPFIFSIGTIAPKKNFHVLPACLLAQEEMRLVVAGIDQSPDYKQQIIDEAVRLGVNDRLIFTGPVTEAEKAWLLAHCSLFAFPSLAEGFGLPIVEAMAFGKPLLLSTATSVPEIGGGQAVYLSDFSSQAMIDGVNKALADHTAHRANLLRERAAGFSWKKAAEQHWELYQKLLQA